MTLDRHGAMRFSYDDEWLADDATPPISLSLPKRSRSFPSAQCVPFFEGLLPEGGERDAVAGALGMSPENVFGILAGVGGEVAGAVSLWQEGEQPPEVVADSEVGGRLSEAGLVDLLDAIKTHAFLANGEGGLRMSLAGAQSKLPVVVEGGEIALPVLGGATTHILKPANDRFPAMTENEAFAMRLAQSVGLSAATVEPRVVDGHAFLMVERYDRERALGGVVRRGAVRRLHQEDFCQALGFVSRRKYAAEGGPGFPECFDLVRHACTRPDEDAAKLLDAAILQVLVGNADAHGKNYSLVRRGPGFGTTVELAPLYDVLCTVAYPGLSPKLAMKIGGAATLEELRPAEWDLFASHCGLEPSALRRRVRELCELAAERCDSVAEELARPGLDNDALRGFAKRIRRRAGRLEHSA